MITLKKDSQIELMKESGRIVALAHQRIADVIKPGVTTAQLDAFAAECIVDEGAIPSFKGYNGYPANICISVNDQVVHGIPGPRVLLEGDVVSVDIGTIKNGYHGDGAKTYIVGEASEEVFKLVEVTRQSFYEGLKFAIPGKRLSDISHAIQSYVEANGFSVVRALVGHGIGTQMHEPPQIPNFGRPGKGLKLRAGMTIAIEPMINMGGWQVKMLDDGWTIVTLDGSLSAHYEHSVAITNGIPLLLTTLEAGELSE